MKSWEFRGKETWKGKISVRLNVSIRGYSWREVATRAGWVTDHQSVFILSGCPWYGVRAFRGGVVCTDAHRVGRLRWLA
jgi:hypothetical protein